MSEALSEAKIRAAPGWVPNFEKPQRAVLSLRASEMAAMVKVKAARGQPPTLGLSFCERALFDDCFKGHQENTTIIEFSLYVSFDKLLFGIIRQAA